MIGERARNVGRRGLHEQGQVRARRERDGPCPEHDQAIRPQLSDQPSEPRTKWGMVGRLPPHDDRVGTRVAEGAPVMLPEGGPGGVEDSFERPGVARELGGEDEDRDRGHGPGV